MLPDELSRAQFVHLLNYEVGSQFPYCQVPDVLEILIGQWFSSRLKDFTYMADALYADYNPIENYDRIEHFYDKNRHSGTDTDTDTLGTSVTLTRKGSEETRRTGSETVSTTGTDTTSHTGTETTQNTGSATRTVNVSAFDASSYTPREQTTDAPSLTDTRTPNLSDVRTPDLTDTRTPDLTDVRTPDLVDTSTNAGSDVHAHSHGHQEDGERWGRAHGNIGVTTSQQLIEAEMEMRQKYSLYDVIIRLFEKEFLSRVY